VNPGYRRAALALSALSKADRVWILKNLSSDERIPLAALLSELERRGIKVPASELQTILESESPPDDEGVGPEQPQTPRERLAQVGADEVFRALSREPDWLVAIVCGMAKWLWLPDFMRMLEDQRASRVQQYIRSQLVENAAVCEALVAAIVERIARNDVADSFRVAPPPLQRRVPQSTLARLTSWLL
jgi:hypothetical protein